MQWDEVERDFFILGHQLRQLGVSFRALARALHREREFRTLGDVRKTTTPSSVDNINQDEGVEQPPLFEGPESIC